VTWCVLGKQEKYRASETCINPIEKKEGRKKGREGGREGREEGGKEGRKKEKKEGILCYVTLATVQD
jgi:hypothetical protein